MAMDVLGGAVLGNFEKIVYGANRSNVAQVWVDGICRVDRGAGGAGNSV